MISPVSELKIGKFLYVHVHDTGTTDGLSHKKLFRRPHTQKVYENQVCLVS